MCSRLSLTRTFFVLAAVTGLGALFIVYLESSRKVHYHGKGWFDDQKDSNLSSNDEKAVKLVFVWSALGRSGTSFLGELLAQYPQNLYLFEPDLYLRQSTHDFPKKDALIALLKQTAYKCDYDDDFRKFMRGRPTVYNVFRAPLTREKCRKNAWKAEKCLTHENLRNACEKELYRLTKVIRGRVEWLPELFDDPDLDVKVVFISRDPRPSLFSMKKLGWLIKPDTLCQGMEEDLRLIPEMRERYSDRFMDVEYERLCLNPFEEATEIWNFVNGSTDQPLPQKWQTFLKSHTNAQSTKKSNNAYQTYRDSKTEMQAWRQEITADYLKISQESCTAVIGILGHRLFNSINEARNISISLFDNS